MKNTERERLLKVAENYAKEELQLFLDETGWEDWMNEYTDATEEEAITEAEAKKIDEILIDIFNEAHAN